MVITCIREWINSVALQPLKFLHETASNQPFKYFPYLVFRHTGRQPYLDGYLNSALTIPVDVNKHDV